MRQALPTALRPIPLRATLREHGTRLSLPRNSPRTENVSRV